MKGRDREFEEKLWELGRIFYVRCDWIVEV